MEFFFLILVYFNFIYIYTHTHYLYIYKCKMMMPKCSPVRCTTLTLEQPVPENRKYKETPSKGGSGVEPAKYPPKVKSENVFYNSRVLERD